MSNIYIHIKYIVDKAWLYIFVLPARQIQGAAQWPPSAIRTVASNIFNRWLHSWPSWFKLDAITFTNASWDICWNARYVISYWPPWAAKKGGIARCFFRGVRVGAAVKLRAGQLRIWINVNTVRYQPGSSVRRTVDFHFSFRTIRLQVPQGMSV